MICVTLHLVFCAWHFKRSEKREKKRKEGGRKLRVCECVCVCVSSFSCKTRTYFRVAINRVCVRSLILTKNEHTNRRVRRIKQTMCVELINYCRASLYQINNSSSFFFGWLASSGWLNDKNASSERLHLGHTSINGIAPSIVYMINAFLAAIFLFLILILHRRRRWPSLSFSVT